MAPPLHSCSWFKLQVVLIKIRPRGGTSHRRYCFTEETVLADVFVFLFKEQELRLAAKFKECVSALPLQALSR